MTKIETARKLKNAMVSRRRKVGATLAELQVLIDCKMAGDFTPMRTTRLYVEYGGEYCEYLSLLNELLKTGDIEQAGSH